jgi:hypothetical protein
MWRETCVYCPCPATYWNGSNGWCEHHYWHGTDLPCPDCGPDTEAVG